MHVPFFMMLLIFFLDFASGISFICATIKFCASTTMKREWFLPIWPSVAAVWITSNDQPSFIHRTVSPPLKMLAPQDTEVPNLYSSVCYCARTIYESTRMNLEIGEIEIRWVLVCVIRTNFSRMILDSKLLWHRRFLEALPFTENDINILMKGSSLPVFFLFKSVDPTASL